jgi:hypothetical protein
MFLVSEYVAVIGVMSELHLITALLINSVILLQMRLTSHHIFILFIEMVFVEVTGSVLKESFVVCVVSY